MPFINTHNSLTFKMAIYSPDSLFDMYSKDIFGFFHFNNLRKFYSLIIFLAYDIILNLLYYSIVCILYCG